MGVGKGVGYAIGAVGRIGKDAGKEMGRAAKQGYLDFGPAVKGGYNPNDVVGEPFSDIGEFVKDNFRRYAQGLKHGNAPGVAGRMGNRTSRATKKTKRAARYVKRKTKKNVPKAAKATVRGAKAAGRGTAKAARATARGTATAAKAAGRGTAAAARATGRGAVAAGRGVRNAYRRGRENVYALAALGALGAGGYGAYHFLDEDDRLIREWESEQMKGNFQGSYQDFVNQMYVPMEAREARHRAMLERLAVL